MVTLMPMPGLELRRAEANALSAPTPNNRTMTVAVALILLFGLRSGTRHANACTARAALRREPDADHRKINEAAIASIRPRLSWSAACATVEATSLGRPASLTTCSG